MRRLGVLETRHNDITALPPPLLLLLLLLMRGT